MSETTRQIIDVFAVLRPDLGVDQLERSQDIYERLDADYLGFKNHVLVSCHEFSERWSTWEKHPAGDEVVVLLSGSATMILRTKHSEKVLKLNGVGEYVVIPRDTWHTAIVNSPTKMLFITPGEGTQNEVDPKPAA